MAISKSAITLQDTNSKYRVMTTGLAGDATELADSVFADLSALKYATTTLTLAYVPTTNFCIGEILTTNDGTPVFMVVQDYTAGAATVDVYRCTSGTDNTALGWPAGTATEVAVGKTLTGSVSGLADELTHGSTRLSINTPTVNLRHLWCDLAAGITYARIYFDGSGTEEDIAYQDSMYTIIQNTQDDITEIKEDIVYIIERLDYPDGSHDSIRYVKNGPIDKRRN